MSKRRKNKIIFPLLIIGIVITSIILTLPFLISGKVEAVPVSFYFEQNIPGEYPHHRENQLAILTLNIGHGRGKGFHQLIQSREKISSNAEAIAETINREEIDITALQEVDGPGLWNGGLDLIENIAEKSGYPHGIWTKNVETAALSYGTALLSDAAYSHAESYTFKARPFILPKGFTMGIFRISENTGKHVCVVSVHLAPLLAPMRRRQADIIIRNLEKLDYPLVIAGDFNCGYNRNSAVKLLADRLNLCVWDEKSEKLGTHQPGNRRLDWIMITKDLEFVSYEVLPDRISDHKAVKAVIRYKKEIIN